MIDISKWAFENKKLIYFLIAVLIAGGAYSSYEMRDVYKRQAGLCPNLLKSAMRSSRRIYQLIESS